MLWVHCHEQSIYTVKAWNGVEFDRGQVVMD
jgi:hypothetical protein